MHGNPQPKQRRTTFLMRIEPRRHLLQIFDAALTAVNGRKCVRGYLETHPLAGPVYLLAVGKAAVAMSQGAQDALGTVICDALVITKQGHAGLLPWPVLEAGHPLPNEQSLTAGLRLKQFVHTFPKNAPVLVLLSGGASALVELLPDGISLDELQRINRWMLSVGLSIQSMNAIRKRLSCIKGGRLAQMLGTREVLCLAISDVPGDDPGIIGSGPLVANSETEPLDVAGFPDYVRAAMDRAPPAPKLGDACFKRTRLEIVATLEDAKRAAADTAARLGYRTAVDPVVIEGNAMAVGTRLAQELVESEPGVVHIWGGETTIKLPPTPGRGGRNQSLALSAALALQGVKDALFLAAGTDGTDGPTLDAGALIDGETVARGQSHGFDACTALDAADAGSFLEASGDLLQTGPTGTNVMDIMLGLRY